MGLLLLTLLTLLFVVPAYGVVFVVYSPIRSYRFRRTLNRILIPLAATWSFVGCYKISPVFLPQAAQLPVAGTDVGHLDFIFIYFPLWLLSYVPGFALFLVLISLRGKATERPKQTSSHGWAACSFVALVSPILLPIGMHIRHMAVETRRQEFRDFWSEVGAYAGGYNPTQNKGSVTHVTFKRIKGVGLARVREEYDIEYLDLTATSVVDDDLQHIVMLHKMRYLSLSRCSITSDGLTYVSDLRAMAELDLSDTSIDDDGLRHLQYLLVLRELSLGGTNTTDVGVQHLAPILASLRELNLQRTNITDASLETLKQFQALRRLDLRKCSVSSGGVADLQQKLPKCEILFLVAD